MQDPVGEYEFSEIQNGVIGDLASKMRFVGTMGVIIGIILMLGGLAPYVTGNAAGGSAGAANVVMGGASAVIGAWTRTAGGAFRTIVQTGGHDIANLMHALSELRRVYTLQRILLIVVMLLLVLAVQLYALFVAGGHPIR